MSEANCSRPAEDDDLKLRGYTCLTCGARLAYSDSLTACADCAGAQRPALGSGNFGAIGELLAPFASKGVRHV